MQLAKYYMYRNLHQDCMSVKYRSKVILRTTFLYLVKVEFRVSESGRQRVIKTKHKNVHATLAMVSVSDSAIYCQEDFVNQRVLDKMVEVTYNPYAAGYFYDKATGREVLTAGVAYAVGTKVYALRTTTTFGKRKVKV